MNYKKPEKGEYLKQVRESKSIDLRTVHEATKIPMDALRAIEEGYTVRTLTPFYYRGFLKIYAQYLGVDVKEVLDDVKEPTEPVAAPISYVDEKDFSEIVREFFTEDKKKLLGKIVAIVVILFLFSRVVMFTKNLFSPKSRKEQIVSMRKKKARANRKKRQTKKSTKKKARKPANAVETVASSKAKAPVKKAKTKENVPKTISFTVRAKTNSWLLVRSDDVVVFRSTLKKGVAETWVANEKIEIVGKNMSQLEFELNGKMISSLGRADRSARKLIITKDGLSVKK